MVTALTKTRTFKEQTAMIRGAKRVSRDRIC